MLNFIGENVCPSKKAKQMTPILVLPIFNLYFHWFSMYSFIGSHCKLINLIDNIFFLFIMSQTNWNSGSCFAVSFVVHVDGGVRTCYLEDELFVGANKLIRS